MCNLSFKIEMIAQVVLSVDYFSHNNVKYWFPFCFFSFFLYIFPLHHSWMYSEKPTMSVLLLRSVFSTFISKLPQPSRLQSIWPHGLVSVQLLMQVQNHFLMEYAGPVLFPILVFPFPFSTISTSPSFELSIKSTVCCPKS